MQERVQELEASLAAERSERQKVQKENHRLSLLVTPSVSPKNLELNSHLFSTPSHKKSVACCDPNASSQEPFITE